MKKATQRFCDPRFISQKLDEPSRPFISSSFQQPRRNLAIPFVPFTPTNLIIRLLPKPRYTEVFTFIRRRVEQGSSFEFNPFSLVLWPRSPRVLWKPRRGEKPFFFDSPCFHRRYLFFPPVFFCPLSMRPDESRDEMNRQRSDLALNADRACRVTDRASAV